MPRSLTVPVAHARSCPHLNTACIYLHPLAFGIIIKGMFSSSCSPWHIVVLHPRVSFRQSGSVRMGSIKPRVLSMQLIESEGIRGREKSHQLEISPRNMVVDIDNQFDKTEKYVMHKPLCMSLWEFLYSWKESKWERWAELQHSFLSASWLWM